MLFRSRERPAGQPSMTTPRALPWDSPQVVILNRVPIVEPAITIPLNFQIFIMIIVDIGKSGKK